MPNKTIQSSLFTLTCVFVCSANAQTAPPASLRQSLSGAFLYEVMAGPNHGTYYPFLKNAPGFGVNYQFRPIKWLALEAGYDQIVRPVGSSVCCEYSTNARDELYLVPFGARYIWESPSARLHFSVGGGGAYVNHSVGNQAGGNVGFSGPGGQFVASSDYALTHSGRFRVGVTARYYLASPKPSVNLQAPSQPASDALHIFVLGPELIFSFR